MMRSDNYNMEAAGCDHVLTAQGISKSYQDMQQQVAVLHAINLIVRPGERIAITGPSGSGKSTLLHLLGGLDFPTSGSVSMYYKDWQTLSEKQRCQHRNQHLGFVYQFHYLLPEFTALENVTMPLLLAHAELRYAVAKATAILEAVGLSHRLDHKPAQLSGGERQRVAIARALVHEPACILADEPTGNLDNMTASKVLEVLLGMNATRKTALVLVTHDLAMAEHMDSVYVLNDGFLNKK